MTVGQKMASRADSIYRIERTQAAGTDGHADITLLNADWNFFISSAVPTVTRT